MKKFVFNNETEGIYPLTLQITDYIKNIAEQFIDEDVSFRVRTILIELLTNSLKHHSEQTTLIEVSLKNNKLSIKKLDKGQPFQIKTRQYLLKWPLPLDVLKKNEIAVYGDDFGTLKGRLKNSNKLEFYTEDVDVQYVDREVIKGLNEHYGLMIITRASDVFNYEYKPGTGANNFTSIIQLGN
ncbi:hypothetical protein [Mucilaginibacter celer]|uniref:ATP-binding protein n=1 Tax=Mucilaginibacter celer TaxID=2305508 RepID=A0A494VX88_9SPHI|nr:hypothetical protein [Mucilaginibacter celer]AYL95855.1 hypothetical protein HYN43_011395 [Mucilaginibacter celer]